LQPSKKDELKQRDVFEPNTTTATSDDDDHVQDVEDKDVQTE
jgi:hypothetical protein